MVSRPRSVVRGQLLKIGNGRLTTDHGRFGYSSAMRIALPLLLIALLPAAALAADAPTTMPAQTYTNPVIGRDAPDPGALRADGAYWMVHTAAGPDHGWPLYTSPDLVHWTFVKNLLTTPKSDPNGHPNKPDFMSRDFWAPEIHEVAGRYVLTGTATSADTDRLSIAIASSDRVDGPYTVEPQPIVADPTGVLDSTIYQEGGKVYLLWKHNAEAGTGVGGSIRLQPMTADGLHLAPGSKPVDVLKGNADDHSPEAGWERGLVEGPWLVKHDDHYYLFYSGAFIDTGYAFGVARSKSLTGPYERCPGNPILRSNAKWGGPGHGSVLQDAAGHWWHLYHARPMSNPDAGRFQVLDRLWWLNGWPAFSTGGTPSIKPQPAPVIFKE